MKNVQVIKYLYFAIFVFICLLLVYRFFITAPINFPVNTTFYAQSGSTLKKISRDLKAESILRSELALQFFAILFGGDKHIVAGDYYFDRPVDVWNVAFRIVLGRLHQKALKITVPEGFSAGDIAKLLSGSLLNFKSEDFLAGAREKEGYLFPDTYFFYPTTTAEEAVKLLSDNFKSQIAPLRGEIKKSGKTEDEIIIMASLIEKESGGPDDKKIISGILWKRIEKSIRLQVDAWSETYDKAGLPDYPISNPGLDSIKAAIYPAPSPYLFYLHEKDGTIHYAKTFEEHRLNIVKYL